MEKRLKNYEIWKIFAMYMPCDVMDLFNDRVGKFVGLDYNNNPVQVLHKTVWHFNYDEVKLLLISLSKITDEHAIEVAKICKPNVVWNITKKEPFNRIVLESNSYRLSIWFVDYYCIEFEYCDTPSHFSSISDVIDRLREIGYALPYKGQSLFDLGIAIDKTTLK